jgi:hypothetical protein
MTKPPPKPAFGVKLARRQQHEQREAERKAEQKRQRQLEREEWDRKIRAHEEGVRRDTRRLYAKAVVLVIDSACGAGVDRWEQAESWTPSNVRLMLSWSESYALREVEECGDKELAGVIIDLEFKDDLDRKTRLMVAATRRLAVRTAKDTPILVLGDGSDGVEVESILRTAGLAVTQGGPWQAMTKDKFQEWLDLCRRIWSERPQNQN